MTRTVAYLAACFALLTFVVESSVYAQGKIPVTAVFRDDFDQVLPDDRIASDGAGPYVHRQDKVSATVDSTEFNLTLSKTSDPGIRKFFLDFTQCASDSCSPPFDTGLVSRSARIRTDDVDLTAMKTGESAAIRLHLHFDHRVEGGAAWIVLFDERDYRATGCTSHRATVTRLSVGEWTIEAAETQLACVIFTEERQGDPWHSAGKYKMPFKLTITKQ